jgi:hypothetical protein
VAAFDAGKVMQYPLASCGPKRSPNACLYVRSVNDECWLSGAFASGGGVPGIANSRPLAATASDHRAGHGSILRTVANWDTRREISDKEHSENLRPTR